MDTGDIVWQVPNGDTPDEIRNNPALKGSTIPRTGSAARTASAVTKTLVIEGEASM